MDSLLVAVECVLRFIFKNGYLSTFFSGERLCDHLKKAKETKTETEAQLDLLLQKLAETGCY